jgi:hypothetical protein
MPDKVFALIGGCLQPFAYKFSEFVNLQSKTNYICLSQK